LTPQKLTGDLPVGHDQQFEKRYPNQIFIHEKRHVILLFHNSVLCYCYIDIYILSEIITDIYVFYDCKNVGKILYNQALVVIEDRCIGIANLLQSHFGVSSPNRSASD